MSTNGSETQTTESHLGLTKKTFEVAIVWLFFILLRRILFRIPGVSELIMAFLWKKSKCWKHLTQRHSEPGSYVFWLQARWSINWRGNVGQGRLRPIRDPIRARYHGNAAGRSPFALINVNGGKIGLKPGNVIALLRLEGYAPLLIIFNCISGNYSEKK